MAEYNKKLSGAADENEQFALSVKRLKNLITAKEHHRRVWSHENFGSPEGALFKIVRVLIPIFSLYLICSMVIYCAIRDAQLLMSNLQDNMMGLSYDAQTKWVEVIIAAVAALCLALVVGNVLLLCKKYYAGTFTCLISSLSIAIHVLTQLNIKMPKYTEGANTSYFTVFLFSSIIYLILSLLCGYILFCKFKVKRTAKRLTDEVLAKISRSTNEMLTPGVYSEKIEQYIEKEKQKLENEINDKGVSDE